MAAMKIKPILCTNFLKPWLVQLEAACEYNCSKTEIAVGETPGFKIELNIKGDIIIHWY